MPTTQPTNQKARRAQRQSFYGEPNKPNRLSPIKSNSSKKPSSKPKTIRHTTIRELAPLSSTRRYPSAIRIGGKLHTKTKKQKKQDQRK
jgi:hypothetical protein